MNRTISREAIDLMRPDSKLGILATTDGEGYPHLSFISSIQALGDDRINFGQFCTGLSKDHVKQRPDVAFLVVSPDMRWLRGNARYDHAENTGPVFDEYNNKPLFRYNCYCGFNTVHFLDLSGISDIGRLPMGKIVAGALLSRLGAPFCTRNEKSILTRTGKGLFSKLDGLKFIGWHNEGGQLEILPIIQAGPAGTDRVVFSRLPYGRELKAIPRGAGCAILGMNLEMQSVLAKGVLSRSGSLLNVLDIERVYNSMPPKAGYIYPREKRPVALTSF